MTFLIGALLEASSNLGIGVHYGTFVEESGPMLFLIAVGADNLSVNGEVDGSLLRDGIRSLSFLMAVCARDVPPSSFYLMLIGSVSFHK